MRWRLLRREPPSIYEHVRRHLAPDETLSEEGENLPDEDVVAESFDPGGSIRWAPGALEGAFIRHAEGSGDARAEAEQLHAALLELADRPTRKSRTRVREALEGTRSGLREVADELLVLLADRPPEQRERLYEEMRSLALRSGHRDEVKLALVVLGAYGRGDDAELFRTLAQHSEFTLYAAIALANASTDHEAAWLELARRARDWGKIELVELLARHPSPEACAYLLRHGCDDIFMPEYVALQIAVPCRLDEALATQGDDALLDGAAALLRALADAGGPGGDLTEYERGAVAVERFLERVGERPPRSLEHLLAVTDVLDFLRAEGEELPEDLGWNDGRRESIAARCEQIVGLTAWRNLALRGLGSPEAAMRWTAFTAAKRLGVPLRAYIVQSLERDPRDHAMWAELVSELDAEGIDEAIALFERLLGAAIESEARGPADELLLAPDEFPALTAAEWILAALQGFPGRGWRIVEPALRSPAVRHRLLALRVLSRWPQGVSPEVRAAVENCLRDPDAKVRAHATAVLRGEELPEPELEWDDENAGAE